MTLACLFVWRVGTDSPFVYSGNTKSRRWNVGHCQLFGDLPLQSCHLTATMMMMMMVLIRNTKDDHGRDILVNQECLRGFANINPFTDPCLSLKLYNKPQWLQNFMKLNSTNPYFAQKSHKVCTHSECKFDTGQLLKVQSPKPFVESVWIWFVLFLHLNGWVDINTFTAPCLSLNHAAAIS